MKLDATRQEIIAATGHVLIKGGPGSGKTTIALVVAQEAVNHLLGEQRVLFLSFSRAAVRQISDRMHETIDSSSKTRLEIRTFHAFFLDLVQAHSPRLTGRPAHFITPDMERRLKFDIEQDWGEHMLELAAAGVYVFDMFAPTVASLLEESEDLRSLYSSAYPLVIVDEFQDTSTDQWRAVRALANGSRIICLADPDQRIYDFVPGVDEHRIEDLRELLSPSEFDLSSDNHRSPSTGILDYANAVLLASDSVKPPSSVVTVEYEQVRGLEGEVQMLVLWMTRELKEALGHEPTIAVLATDNNSVVAISEKFMTAVTNFVGVTFPPIDHQLHFEAELAAAAGYVVASILEWPTIDRNAAIINTLEAVVDYYRTVGGLTAKKKVSVLTNGLKAFLEGTTVRSKTATCLIAAFDSGVRFEGEPVSDWQLARSQLIGTAELTEMFRKVRHLRLLNATDDLAWGLLGAWDGASGYFGAASLVRRILAERILDDSAAKKVRVNLMSMHRSKGKEFDAVVIVEGLYRAQLFADQSDYAVGSSRRRLIRVALTRARHRVLLVRPKGSAPLTATHADAVPA